MTPGSARSEPQPFDLTGPLPTGLTVLEASAGTGKTYTIAELVTRYVAGGLPLDQLLLVTFTRAATGELRQRVRDRFVLAEAQEDLPERRARLANAISNFDAVTIETTHGFCQRVLDGLGTLAQTDPDASFVADNAELFSEVVADLYIRGFYRRRDGLSLTYAAATDIAEVAIDNPTAPIHPESPASGSANAMRVGLAVAARQEFEARKRRLALMTYDDQLTLLLQTLEGASGADAVASLQARYRVVLIDEFQDTDQTQWQIVKRAFGEGSTTLVLIGDPKQAIYAFRGADVYSYIQAVESATQRRTLAVNHRSDQSLLDGLDALFGHARLGHAEISYRKVSATPAHQGSRLVRAPVPQALRLRIVDSGELAVERTPTGFAKSPSARGFIARDLAIDIVSLLNAGARIEGRDERGAVTGSAEISPGDIAVLVKSGRQAELIQAQLGLVGVPAVIGGSGSVFGTAAAVDWLALLEALERPADPRRARAAALTPLFGMRAADLANAAHTDTEIESLHRTLHEWTRLLRERGVAALTRHVFASQHVAARLLTELDGERHLTDLQHVAELLNAAGGSERFGVTALSAWLRERIAAARRERGNDELTRRLDSDADAVQVLTIHSSKGLEFPIVYCPFLWDGWHPDHEADPVYFHDRDVANRRAIDVGIDGAERRSHVQRFQAEDRGEELRLAYVALTRARHQAVVWWASSWDAKDSPLGRLLFAQDKDGNVATQGRTRVKESDALKTFGELSARAPHAVSVEQTGVNGLPSEWSGGSGEAVELAAARFDRELDVLWRRTSYSAITAAAYDPRAHELVVSEPEQREASDEPSGPPPTSSSELPLSAMASGPELGTLIHRVLEATDFADEDLAGSLATYLSEATTRNPGLLGCTPEQAGASLAQALATPLGGQLGALRLRDVTTADRLDELSFELPLAGGDTPSGEADLRDLAALLREHVPAGDPLHGYAERLLDPSLTSTLRGYLTGTIDLVLRRRGADGRLRYSVVDYKTNWLAPPGEPLTAWHYRPQALAAEMQSSHYALQALLYSVALHRYLRWRLSGYDPSMDLAGVHYLFLRGMVPDGDGSGAGVFFWQPPSGLILGLSELLDGR